MKSSMLVIALGFSVLIILTVVKTYYFFKATRRRNLRRWLRFTTQQVITAKTNELTQLRRRQNTMSLVLFLVLLITIVNCILAAKGII